MAEQLYELAYVSDAVQHMEQEELDQLLEQARNHNHEHAISGMLLYAEGAFIQVLEGEREPVRALYHHICADSRHTHAQVLHEGPINKRSFPDWKMGFRRLDAKAIQRRPGFTNLLQANSPARDAFRLHPNHSHQLLMSFSECGAVMPKIEPLNSANEQDNRQ